MFNSKLFAKKLDNLEPYKVDTNKYKARLDANESFIQMPEEIRNEFVKIMRATEFNRYPDPDAKQICNSFADFYGIAEQNVACGNGSDEIISIIMNTFLDKGACVMTFLPDFSMYSFYAGLAELENVMCQKNDSDLKIDFNKADKLIKEKCVRLVIFSNPCNPTGQIEKKADISRLCKDNPDTIFIVDEAYMDFAGEQSESESFLRDVCDYSNIIVLKTLSKALGSANLRLGFIVAHEKVIHAFKAVKSPYNVNGLSQSFGGAILKNKTMLEKSLCDIKKAKEELFTLLSENKLLGNVKYYDTSTNFIFCRTPHAKKIYEYLKENGVLIRYFNIEEGALRITAGSKQENAFLLKLLKEFKGEIL